MNFKYVKFNAMNQKFTDKAFAVFKINLFDF